MDAPGRQLLLPICASVDHRKTFLRVDGGQHGEVSIDDVY